MTGIIKSPRRRIWDDRRKRNASEYVAERIGALQHECTEADAQIERAHELVSFRRVSSDSQTTGTVPSMRKVLQLEALKKKNAKAIAELQHLILELWASDMPLNYISRAGTIINHDAGSSSKDSAASGPPKLEGVQEPQLNQAATVAA